MKNLLLALIAVAGIGFTSCGDDDPTGDCQTCELSVLITTVSTEYCEDGANVIQTVEGGTPDTLFNTTLADAVSAQEALGATCN